MLLHNLLICRKVREVDVASYAIRKDVRKDGASHRLLVLLAIALGLFSLLSLPCTCLHALGIRSDLGKGAPITSASRRSVHRCAAGTGTTPGLCILAEVEV